MTKSLPRTSPHAAGVSPDAVAAFTDAVGRDALELHSFMVLRHGMVTAECAWMPYSPERPHMLFSLSKSFTSTAVGFAVTEGLLSVDDPVLKFFREEAPERPGRHWQDMKVRHLLSMSTGHAKDTTGFMTRRRDGDWAASFLRQPLRYEPGTHFLYNTGATYMLSVIVQKLTGQRVLDYLTPRLFEPLGIEGATWEQCPKGYDTGGFGLAIKTEDIAKFGQFLLQRGMWEGRQLLPAAWVDEATRKQVDNGQADGTTDWGEGYGYQFWRCIPGCYRGDGAFGQYCVVMPERDAVVAINSGLGDMQAVLKHIWNILLPGMKDGLPADPGAEKAMAEKLASLRYDPPAAARTPMEELLAGRKYGLERNPEHRKSIRFAFKQDECEVTVTAGKSHRSSFTGSVETGAGTYRTQFGRGRWIKSTMQTPLGVSDIAAAFTWEGENTLVLTARILGTPFVLTERISFAGGELELTERVNVGFEQKEPKAVKGVLQA